MKVISVWQPYASLQVHNFKFIETRTWAAPRSLIGQTIGIASTKVIRPEQRVAYLDPNFQRYYRETGLPALDDLPHGHLLGTCLLHSCELYTAEMEDEITEEELAFGWYKPGQTYLWRMRYPRAFATPIPVRGKQGVWDLPTADILSFQSRPGRGAPATM